MILLGQDTQSSNDHFNLTIESVVPTGNVTRFTEAKMAMIETHILSDEEGQYNFRMLFCDEINILTRLNSNGLRRD